MGRRGTASMGWWIVSFVAVPVCVVFVLNAVFLSGGVSKEHLRDLTRPRLMQIKTALQGYSGAHDCFPSTDVGLIVLTTGPVMEMEYIPKDSWGSAFIYAMPPAPQDASHPFTLRSAGPDRIAFTADDIDVWTLNH